MICIYQFPINGEEYLKSMEGKIGHYVTDDEEYKVQQFVDDNPGISVVLLKE